MGQPTRAPNYLYAFSGALRVGSTGYSQKIDIKLLAVFDSRLGELAFRKRCLSYVGYTVVVL